MWRTSNGERVLQGAERDLFCAGIAVVWDLVEDSDEDGDLSECGLEAFDCLQQSQKLALLALVGEALSNDAVQAPALTAHTEATVASVFQHIRESTAMEVETASAANATVGSTFWRRLILAACQQVEADEPDSLPSMTSEEFDEWDLLLECLAGRILWDSDYEMGDVFLDADPAKTHADMRMLGIADDYYRAVAPDATDQDLPKVRDTLRAIIGRSEPRAD
jgi:hypothetical protein